MALAWHKTNKKWSADYAGRQYGKPYLPAVGHLPVAALKTQDFTALLRVIENKGFLETRSEPGSNSATSCAMPFSRDLPTVIRRSIWKV
ncbi:hypothetical protein ACLB1N_12335 [Escherichia coli]